MQFFKVEPDAGGDVQYWRADDQDLAIRDGSTWRTVRMIGGGAQGLRDYWTASGGTVTEVQEDEVPS